MTVHGRVRPVPSVLRVWGFSKINHSVTEESGNDTVLFGFGSNSRARTRLVVSNRRIVDEKARSQPAFDAKPDLKCAAKVQSQCHGALTTWRILCRGFLPFPFIIRYLPKKRR